jgi:hypothetical protein
MSKLNNVLSLNSNNGDSVKTISFMISVMEEVINQFKEVSVRKAKIAKSNNGVLSMKTIFVINDLESESSKLAVGDSSLARVSAYGDMHGEFAGENLSHDAVEYLMEANDDEAEFLGYDDSAETDFVGYGSESVDYQNGKEERELDEEYMGSKANAIIKHTKMNSDFSNLSDELKLLLAEQITEDTENITEETLSNPEIVIKVRAQQKGIKGFWYDLTDKANRKDKTVRIIQETLDYKGKIFFEYAVEDLCLMNNGVIEDFKMAEYTETRLERLTNELSSETKMISLIKLDMADRGFNVDGDKGRILMESSAFGAYSIKDNTNEYVQESVGNFYYEAVKLPVQTVKTENGWKRVITVTGEVAPWFTGYSWDNMTEIETGLFVIPATTDTTIATLEERKMKKGIITGDAHISKELTSYYMSCDERDRGIVEEKRCDAIEHKAKISAEVKKSMIAYKEEKQLNSYNALMETKVGKLATVMIGLSYFDSKAVEEYAAENMDILSDILDAMFEIKKVTGKGAQYTAYKKLAYALEQQLDSKADVDMVQLIKDLNGNKVMCNQLNDKQVVLVLDTAKNQSVRLEKDLWSILNARSNKISKDIKLDAVRAKFPKEVA